MLMTHSRSIVASLLLSVASAFAIDAADDTMFTNPVIYADVPDTDLIRVGDDYYMISTTVQYSPGAPLMHSTDLVNWNIVSYVFDEIRESPANYLENGNIYSRGQWAASLKYHDGKFYVFFGTGNRSYLYEADSAAGPWRMRANIDKYYHDAGLLFDDGHLYLAYGGSHIRLAEFTDDLSGIDPNGVDVELIHGEPKGLLEGTHFYKIGDKYYLTLIWWPEGGTRTQVCFRSDNVAGPYDEMKVILSDDLGYPGHGVAQGNFFELPDGRWYAMLFQDHEAVGRVPVLTECRWEDGWPILGNAEGKVSPVMAYPLPDSGERTALTVSDDFSNPTLGITWQWNHNPDNSLWSLTEREGWLRLRTGKTVENIFDARNTLTQRTFGPRCLGTVRIDASHLRDGDHAGLGAFCSDPGTVEVVKEDGKLYVVMTDRLEQKARILLKETIVDLRMQCDFTTDTATFSYSTDNGRSWKLVGEPFHMIFSMKHFIGNKFAIFCYSTLTPGGYADFDYFNFEKE